MQKLQRLERPKWRNLVVFINLLTGILTNANAPTRNINNSWINLCSCEQLHIKRAPTKVKFGHKNASDEEEIQSVLDESLESLSFIRICCCCYVLCVVCCVAQMNTDGHAKGSAFDGLHSHFPALPLIPIYVCFVVLVFLERAWRDAWWNIILWMTVNIGRH